MIEDHWGMLPYWRERLPPVPWDVEVEIFGRTYVIQVKADGTLEGRLADAGENTHANG